MSNTQNSDPIGQIQENVGQSIGAAIGLYLGFLLHGFTLTFHAFLRRGFGEKKCTPFHVAAGLSLLLTLFAVAPAGSPLVDKPEPTAMEKLEAMGMTAPTARAGRAAKHNERGADETIGGLLRLAYLGGFLVLSVRHGWPHWRRFVTDRFERNISVSSGASVLRRGRLQGEKEFHLKIFAEPLAVFFVAVPVFLIDKGFGGYLIFGSFALFGREWITHGFWRDKITGHIDDMIDGAFTASVLKKNIDDQGKPAAEASNNPWGDIVRIAFANSEAKEISLDDMIKGLDPKLQKIMTTQQPKHEDQHPLRYTPLG